MMDLPCSRTAPDKQITVFQQLLEFVPVGVLLLSPNGSLLLANQRAVDILQGSVHTSFYSSFNKKNSQRLKTFLRTIVKQKKEQQITIERTAAKQKKTQYLTCTGVFISSEGFEGIMLTLEDNTQHMQGDKKRIVSEEMLRKNNSILQAIIEGVHDAIFVKDIDGKYVMINASGSRFLGKPVKALLGKSPSKLFPQKEAERILKTDRSVMKTGKTMTYEERLTGSDGQKVYLTTKGPYRDQDGNPLGIIGISRDITQQKKSEEVLAFLSRASALLSSSLDYKTTLASLAKLIVPYMADWCVIDIVDDANPLASRLAIAHRDPKKIAMVKKLGKEYPSRQDATSGVYHVIRTGEPELYPEITDELLVKFAHDKKHFTLLQKAGFRSAMIVPLQIKKKTYGAISFITAESNRHYTQADLLFAQELARRASQAIDNALLYQKAQEEIRNRKKAEELNKHLAAIVESSEDAITGRTLDGIITAWNKGAEKLFGYTSEEMIGQSTLLLIPAYRLDEYYDIVRMMQNGRSIEHYETTRITKNGKEIFVSITISPIKDDQGNVIGFSTIDRDITQRKLMEEELRKSKNQLEVIFQSVADGITVQDTSGKIIFSNEAAAKAMGFDSAQKVYKIPITKILEKFAMFDEYGNVFPFEKLPGRRALKGEAAPEALIHFKTKNGKTDAWSLVKAKPVKDSQGNILFAINVFHDITARRELEQRRDDFIGMASHELKTPVTSIQAYAQFIKVKLNQTKNKELVNYMDRMDQQLQKLTYLVNDLLDFTKAQSGKLSFHKEWFSLEKLVDETIEDIQRITVTHTIKRTGTVASLLYADRYRIGQVITNLLTNAIKYSPNADSIVVTLAQQKDAVVLSVKDYGVGISKQDQKSLFERFFRGSDAQKRTFPGVGVGLYITKQIITRHGGEIWVKSNKKDGTTFSVQLSVKEKEGGDTHEKNTRH